MQIYKKACQKCIENMLKTIIFVKFKYFSGELIYKILPTRLINPSV